MDQKIIEEMRRLACRAQELSVLLDYWADKAEDAAVRKEDAAFTATAKRVPPQSRPVVPPHRATGR